MHGAGGRRARALLPGAARRVPGARRSRPSRGWPRAATCTRCSRRSRSSAPPSAATARPGILLTAEALLADNPTPDPRRDARMPSPATSAAARATRRSSRPSSWPRCACSAPRAPAASPGDRAMSKRFSVIGQSLPKIDAWAKVTGETQLRRRPRPAAHGLRQAPAQPARPRAHHAHRHHARAARCPASTRSSPGTTCRA